MTQFLQGDLGNRTFLRQVLQGVECVFHCAVAVTAMSSRERLWRENHEVLRALLEESAAQGVKHLVLVSSSSVHGKFDVLPLKEEMPPRPTDAYGHVRLAMEEMALSFAPQRLPVTVLRPHLVLGPGRGGIFIGLLDRLEAGGSVYLPRSVRFPHQVIHVDDLVAACWLAASRRRHGLYHVGAPAERPVLDFIEEARLRLNRLTRVRFVPDILVRAGSLLEQAFGLSLLGPNKALMAPRGFYFDCSKARAELGFSPRSSEADGWRMSLEWYLSQRQARQSEAR